MKSSLVVVGVSLLLLDGSRAAAQSLADVAAVETARRKAIARPAQVMRETDLRSDYPVTTPTELPAWPDDAAAGDPAAARRLVEPASLQAGPLPPIPVMAVAGGEVFLEVAVGSDGAVSGVKPFRATPPFTDALSDAVKAWRFEPAEDAVAPPPGQPVDETTRKAAASKVLVVGLFRPPALFNVTLGEPPKDVATPAPDVPAPVGAATMPDYPMNALFDGSVLMELRLGVDGAVMRRRLVRSAPGFDAPALIAVNALSFRPARVRGVAVPSVAYVLLAFRQPITQ